MGQGENWLDIGALFLFWSLDYIAKFKHETWKVDSSDDTW